MSKVEKLQTEVKQKTTKIPERTLVDSYDSQESQEMLLEVLRNDLRQAQEKEVTSCFRTSLSVYKSICSLDWPWLPTLL